jgi:hypothetical protein
VHDPLTDLRWFIVVGLVLVLMAIGGSWIGRLPLSTSVVYLAVGVAIGPLGLGLLVIDPVANAPARDPYAIAPCRAASRGRRECPRRRRPPSGPPGPGRTWSVLESGRRGAMVACVAVGPAGEGAG